MALKIFKKVSSAVFKPFIRIFGGKEFASKPFPASLLMKHIIIQKIFRINPKVNWPVHWTSKIIAPENIKSGTRAPGLGLGCYLDGRNGIIFEENVWIGPRVSIISMNHDENNYKKYIKSDPIIIRKNCWLASNCVITAGVELGEHTIVASGAVVTKSFPEGNQLLAGIPAKAIKKLDSYNDQE
jgi:acetyltransferase-like isoleucine patch superfamily enzyme